MSSSKKRSGGAAQVAPKVEAVAPKVSPTVVVTPKVEPTIVVPAEVTPSDQPLTPEVADQAPEVIVENGGVDAAPTTASEPPVPEEQKPVFIPQLTTEPVVEEPTKEPTVADYFKERYPNMADIPVGVKAVMETLDAYNEAMHPGRPIEPRKAAQFQRSLYYSFLSALGLPGRQSQLALDAILWYFNTHRQGAYSQYLIFRPIPANTMSKAEIESLRMLLHLFYNTADPKTRKVNLRSMVDMRKVVETLPNPKTRESLLNFYA